MADYNDISTHEQGVCPVCKSTNIDYGSMRKDDYGVYRPCECENCGATFDECYDLRFDRHNNISKR